MGVDHDAFACYGAKINLNEGADVNDVENRLIKAKLGYCEWGSRAYGGVGGYIVCDVRSKVHATFRESGCRKIPTCPVDPETLKTRIEKLIADGAPFTLASEVAWWVGGHTW